MDPAYFHDAEISEVTTKITTQVYNKMKKFPVHWTSRIPVRYKHNAIRGELYRAKKIGSNFDIEIKHIVNKIYGCRIP